MINGIDKKYASKKRATRLKSPADIGSNPLGSLNMVFEEPHPTLFIHS